MYNEVEIEIDLDVFLPCYHRLHDETGIDIDFLYGSRDSGKSRDIAQRLVKKCLDADYFRHLLIRKTFNTIKDSQWQLIKDVVEDWGLSDFFHFTTNPLEIHCKNGNKFVARGFDDAQKIKSFQNPSGAWVEEGNELTKDDWVTLRTSIRSNKVATKIDFSFNPEADGDYRDSWLYKDYFSHTEAESFTNTKQVKVKDTEETITYRATHTTYHDNPFCSSQRKAIYEDLKDTSPYHYQVYGLGKWANSENKSPFVLTFSREKHLGKPDENGIMQPVWRSDDYTYLSMDFNRNPMCCSVIQWDGANKVDWVEVIKIPNSTIYEMCEYINVSYPEAIFIVCGDGSGSNRSALVQDKDLNDYYKVIKKELRLNDTQMQQRINPPIAKNKVLVNYCFKHLDITLNPETCNPLIFDIEFGEIQADGTLLKGNREDPKQQLDALDTMRYFLNRYFAHLNPLNE